MPSAIDIRFQQQHGQPLEGCGPVLYRPTALNRSPVHSALASAYQSPSTVSFASCYAAMIYYAHTTVLLDRVY